MKTTSRAGFLSARKRTFCPFAKAAPIIFVIVCDFPIITEDSKDQGANDPVQSGRYLIVDLCHHFDPTRSITSMTLVRDSYGLYSKNN